MNTHSTALLDAAALTRIPKNGFGRTRVLVVGDVMLDRYVLGDVTRISPEAPVPVVAVNRRRAVPGGAANVALNIVGLRAQTILAGVIGNDDAAEELSGLLLQTGIDVSGLTREQGRPTTCKTRVMCGNHQIVRLDEESNSPVRAETAHQLFDFVLSCIDGGCHAVILSDYAKGLLTPDFTRKVIQACRNRSIPVLVDPKRSDYMPYSGVTCITPNLKEFRAAAAILGLEEDLSTAGPAFLSKLGCDALLVTQGADGMTLFAEGDAHHLPALAEEVFDVSGAGDTVISTMGTALGFGLDILTAVQLSNIAASLVVRKAGTAPVEWNALSHLVFAPDTDTHLAGIEGREYASHAG